jgi:hypothetical protein
MNKAIRVPIFAAAVAALVVSLTPSAAQAQVRFEGRFRLPHGDIAVGVGDPYYYGAPAYPIGSYVPYGYRVIEDPYLGHGFYGPANFCRVHRIRHAHWIPVRRHSARWVVIERPHFTERYYRRYDDRRYSDRRYSRRDGRRYSGDPYYDFNRMYWDRSYRNPYDRR